MHTKYKALAALLALVLALSAAPALAQQPQPEATEKVPILGLFENTKLDLSPYKGKAIFLNFFTEWCPYCMQEMPEIKQIFTDYSPAEMQIILVHVWDGENAANSESIKAKYGLEDMTFFEDEDMGVARMIGLPGYPTSVFIDKEGNLHTAMAYALNYDTMAQIMDEMGVTRLDGTVAHD